ncbi:type II CRISPR RNA-guided endonuclease Cas9 [Sphingomonas sp. A2-49]|uniref:type II CRISPR RNA-guided endonuclease Cas9 n=1 Tax=Sphingomonas sp. A2-49 TaxID=1391375 RepID=UPI0021CF1E7B|nr:type II CRISPR RNA-guided endonuclease Cas9 [Sphingomonas sp. A2-49]MCU6455523.1 type II CRISPR RNA-guided endonuclease Cas9 [Sphingomonas sp. A2-49]
MRRLGLDIGTNSIGWCLIENDAGIADIGVRIFSDGRDPQSGTSLAVDRREARSARRRRDRYVGRRSAFLAALVEHGLMPADADEAQLVAALDPYVLRARALDEPLAPHAIGRALFHLNQRRGFKSNRKAERKATDGEDGKIASGARALDQAMADEGADTLGQFLLRRETKRVRMGGENQDYDFYPQRRHVEYEFDRIWQEQARHHPALLTETARAALHRILFYQRPLKEQPVGLCTFVPSERRLAKAHPLFQQRRLYEEVNQLEVTTPGEANRKLTLDERDRLVRELSHKKAIAFTSLGNRIKLEPGQSFNKASDTRTQLAGDEVRAVLGDRKRFGAAWENFDRDRQWAIVERLIEEEDPDALHAFLTRDCGLDDAHAATVARTSLPEGHGRLGATATARILSELQAEVITYDEAVRRCGWHHSDHRTGEILPQLPYYGELLTRDIPPGTQDPADPPEKRWGKITNPTVHIGLRQLEKLVNAIITVHGRPDEIVVELARELKLNEKDKEDHNRRIRRDTAAAVRRSEKLTQEGIADTGGNRMLLRLWEDLNPANPLDRRCPYCGRPIGMRALFSGEADVDHIIPYSRSLDDSAGNKVVAHRSCNRIKGNRTPFEKWGHDPDRWDAIAAEVGRLHTSRQWRFGPDAMARVEKDGGFLARQLTDTQYLSRMAGRYLGSLYASADEGSVYVIPGRMTAMLRRLWGLNELLGDHNIVENRHSNAPKNRLDHRHHAIDAAVVAVTTRRLMQRIARTAGLAEDKNLDRLFEGLDQPWEGFRDELRERLRTIVVSHKADHGRTRKPAPGRDVTAGRLHNDTAYGLTGETSPKGLPIVVHRVPLASLKPADIAAADRIPDPALRAALADATAGRSGKDFDAAIARFARQHPQFAGTRRVRVREPLSVIPIRDGAGRIYKAYKGDSNARFDVWRLPDGKWVSDIVSMFDAHQPDQGDRRPHPAAKRVLSLHQNDMLAIERDGGPREIVRVVKFSTIGTLQLAASTEAGALKARDAAPPEVDPFKYINSSAGGLKKIRARQVRIDPLGRILDPGPR